MENSSDNKVQLGCGTLIVIALIVMIFSGDRDTNELQKEVRDLSTKIERLETKIDEISKKLDEAPAVANETVAVP